MNADILSSLWLIALSVASGVAGQTVIKLGVSQPRAAVATPNLLSLVTMIVQSPLIVGGLLLYGIGALAWIMVLRRLDLSYAYPFLALNFVLITVISYFILDEQIPPLRLLGVGIIVVGILLIARSGATA